MGDGESVLARLDSVDQAARELDGELRVLRDRTRTTRLLHERGYALSAALARSQGPACHERVAEHMAHLGQAVHRYRCALVRHLVDVEGWSLSDVARCTGNARQVVSRLYHSDEDDQGPCARPKLRLRDVPAHPGRASGSASRG